MNDDKPKYTDVSHDARAWDEVCPDQYWGPENCMGKEISLQIGAIQLEQYGDDRPRPVLVFLNDKKWLRLSRDNRQVLKELFGASPSTAVGKWITITAGPNQMKTIVVKILPRNTQPPATTVQGGQSFTAEELEELQRMRQARMAQQSQSA